MTLHERTLNRPPRLPRTAALVARVGLALTLAGALSLLLSGVGTRWDWWDYRTGFLLLRWTLYAGLVVIGVALTGLVLGVLARTGKSLLVSLVTLAVLGAVAAVPVGYLRSAGRVPPIQFCERRSSPGCLFAPRAPASNRRWASQSRRTDSGRPRRSCRFSRTRRKARR